VDLLGTVERLEESNPMLGMRGVRLGVARPGLYAMQVRAIMEAACDVKEKGGRPVVEIMIPLVAVREELEMMRAEAESVIAEVLDQAGVGRLVRIAVAEGRAARPGLKVGICGEHGGDPASVEFCHTAGLDYVSCSPFRVPVARLAAAHAALKDSGVGGSETR